MSSALFLISRSLAAPLLSTFQVSGSCTHSDNLAIILEIGNQMHLQKSKPPKKVQTSYETDTEQKAEYLVKHVSKACESAMCRNKQGTYRKPAYWNENIAALRSATVSKGTAIGRIHKTTRALQEDAK